MVDLYAMDTVTMMRFEEELELPSRPRSAARNKFIRDNLAELRERFRVASHFPGPSKNYRRKSTELTAQIWTGPAASRALHRASPGRPGELLESVVDGQDPLEVLPTRESFRIELERPGAGAALCPAQSPRIVDEERTGNFIADREASCSN